MVKRLKLTFWILTLLAATPVKADSPVWGITTIVPWGAEAEQPDKPSISAAIIHEIGRRMARDFQIDPMPYARLLHRIETDSIDFGLSFRRRDAEAFSAYPVCLFRVPIVAYARKGLRLERYEDLDLLKGGVGIIRGVTYGERFENDPDVTRSVETDFPPMLRKLAAGRLDGVAGSSVVLMHYAKEAAAFDLLGDRILLTLAEACVQVPKARLDAPLTQAVVKVVEAMAAEGWAESLITRYVGQGWE